MDDSKALCGVKTCTCRVLYCYIITVRNCISLIAALYLGSICKETASWPVLTLWLYHVALSLYTYPFRYTKLRPITSIRYNVRRKFWSLA